MDFNEVGSMIKSCVLSKKGDMTLKDLRGEYFQLVGQDIPFKSLGCDTLEVLIRKLPGISISKNSRGEFIVFVASQKAAHIANLVNKQKPSNKNKRKGKISYSSRKPFRAVKTFSPKKSQMTPCNSPSKFRILSNTKKLPQRSGTSLLSRGNKNIPLTKDRTYYSPRLSQTQVRFIPAGEESSDDSFVCPPVQKNDLSMTENSREVFNGADASDLAQNELHSSSSGWSDGHIRTVKFTGSSLRCTLSISPLPNERPISPVNSEHLSEEKVQISTVCNSWDNGPVMFGFHLVGDDFLLDFAYECLHVDCEWDDSERLSCGMCISGQTIHDFHMQICHEGLIQRRIVIMLGAVDILQNNSLRCIIDDMTDLVDDITNSPVESVVLLTLPFLKNGGLANRKVLVYNEFLKTLTNDHRVYVLDTYPLFNNRSRFQTQTYENCFNPKCYELTPREILCYPHGVVLWSHIGRTYLYNFLLQELNNILKNLS